MRLVLLYFSPTGGVQRALGCLAEAWADCAEVRVDLACAALDFSGISLGEGDLCLAAAPSYGGRVPAPALERAGRIRGNGAAAVAVAVYGNRAYDDTLLEWKEALRTAGFRCVAAVAEHSIVRRYGAGRPDEADRRELLGFGKSIRAALESGVPLAEPATPGSAPYREYRGVPFHPAAGKGCDRCGICAKACPVGAIPAGDPTQTDAKTCLSCMRCVAVCPQKARRVNRAALLAAARMLKKPCAERKANELFLSKMEPATRRG